MHANAVSISEDEIREFTRVATDVLDLEKVSLTATRYTPDFGAATEVVTVIGSVHGQYAREGGRRVADFEQDIRAGFVPLTDALWMRE